MVVVIPFANDQEYLWALLILVNKVINNNQSVVVGIPFANDQEYLWALSILVHKVIYVTKLWWLEYHLPMIRNICELFSIMMHTVSYNNQTVVVGIPFANDQEYLWALSILVNKVIRVYITKLWWLQYHFQIYKFISPAPRFCTSPISGFVFVFTKKWIILGSFQLF